MLGILLICLLGLVLISSITAMGYDEEIFGWKSRRTSDTSIRIQS